MGLFNFSKYNDIEKALLDLYTQTLSMMNMPSAEAKKMSGDILDQAIEESKKEGTYYLPQNLGDIILGNAESNNPAINRFAECIRQKLPKKKMEGVKDEDVRRWWNLNDIERRMTVMQDNISKTSSYIMLTEKNNESSQEKRSEKAVAKVKKSFPDFDDSDDTSYSSGDDKPLPYELKDRINIYIQKRTNENPEKFKTEIEQASSFNALIRREIKTGNL